MESKPFSSREALRFGWDTTLRNVKPLLAIGVAGAFLVLLQNGLSGPHGPGGLRSLLALALQVLQVGISLAYVRAALQLQDGKTIAIDRPASLVIGFWPFLLTMVLYGLIVGFGLLLLVVPGIIWALRYSFAGFFVADGERDPLEALRRSHRLTNGVKGQLLELGLLLFVVNLLGAIALGIGLLVTVPTSMVAAAHVFRRLQSRAAERTLPRSGLTEAPAR